MTINFYLNKDNKSKNPEMTIYVYIRGFGGKTIVFNTGEKINPKFWNIARQEAKFNYIGHIELNSYLNDFKEKIKRYIRVFLTENKEYTFEDFKEYLNKVFKQEITNNGFFQVFELFFDMRKNELSELTIKKFIVLKNHLLDFQNELNYNITFKNIDLTFYDKFSNYLITVKKQSNNTISKYIVMLKTFLNWSAERKFHSNTDFKEFKTRTNKTDIIYLTEPELLTLLSLDLTKNSTYDKIRDVFCFACFTGQRFSDVANIKREDLKNDIWHLRVKKTKDVLKIPINQFARLILDKYKDYSKPLPTISNQKANQYIKEICQLAGFDDLVSIVKYSGSHKIEQSYNKYDLVTTHTARRTFVTLSLEKGMRIETLMEITGHKDYKTLKKYIKITNQVKQNEMNKVWNNQTLIKIAK
jgi:integrase